MYINFKKHLIGTLNHNFNLVGAQSSHALSLSALLSTDMLHFAGQGWNTFPPTEGLLLAACLFCSVDKSILPLVKKSTWSTYILFTRGWVDGVQMPQCRCGSQRTTRVLSLPATTWNLGIVLNPSPAELSSQTNYFKN